jgi:hypothetical protein
MAPPFIITMCGHFIKPWGASLLTLNMETGEAGEPPPDIWDRIARRSPATDAELLVQCVVHECAGGGGGGARGRGGFCGGAAWRGGGGGGGGGAEARQGPWHRAPASPSARG